MERNYYELFGIKETATPLEIKLAYRRLVFKYHPDRNRGDVEFENMFKEINRAYEVLSHSLLRHQYDEMLRMSRNPDSAFTYDESGRGDASYDYREGSTWQPYGRQYYNNPTKDRYMGRFLSIWIVVVFIAFTIFKAVNTEPGTTRGWSLQYPPGTYNYQPAPVKNSYQNYSVRTQELTDTSSGLIINLPGNENASSGTEQ